MPLTDTYLRKAKGAPRPFKKADGGGLFILIQPDGKKLWRFSYRFTGKQKTLAMGVYPITDLAAARIALEIAAERMGAALFGNGAMPPLIFKFQQGNQGFKTDEEGKNFIENFQNIYAKRGRFKGMLLPKGMEVEGFPVENDKAQFLATRQYQRTVIAGAFGVPPHLVGDLSKGTFRNVEQQSLDFVLNVVMPYVRMFEAAMERALLTPQDRSNGVIIRFNLDAALRADFKSRQEGLNIQRNAGVINPNEWREMEGMKGSLIFATARDTALSDMTLTKLIRDLGWAERSTVHGIRSSFREWCALEAKVPDRIAEAALAHIDTDRVQAAYLRSNFVEERRKLMQSWADFVLIAG